MSDLFPSDSEHEQEQEQQSVDGDWPTYPLCQFALHATELGEEKGQVRLNCVKLFRALGNHASARHLRQRLRKLSPTEHPWRARLQKVFCTHQWVQASKTWEVIDPAPVTAEWTLLATDMRPFLDWAQARTRKTQAQKTALYRSLGIELTEAEQANLPVPIENQVLALLEFCLPYPIEYQYRVGKYRVDAFIPRLRLAIQIDEHGHQGYSPQEEKAYDTALRDANIECLRYNPDAHHAHPGASLIQQVWAYTLRPAFEAFRQKHKLTG